jgi:TRAP transporter TAXI family solute receptor
VLLHLGEVLWRIRHVEHANAAHRGVRLFYLGRAEGEEERIHLALDEGVRPAHHVGHVDALDVGTRHAGGGVKRIEQFQGRPYADLRATAILYPLRVTFFVRKDSGIRTMADLKGKRVTDGYGSQKTVPPILDALLATGGLTRADVQGVNVPNVVGGAEAFIQGKADAFFFALGAAKVEEANASVGGIRALGVPNTPENLAKVQQHFPPAYLRAEKPSPRNVGVLEPIHAMAYDGVLVASVKTPEDVVYRLVKAMHGHKKVMAAVFGAMNLFDPQDMAKPLDPIQWHAGAVRFYKEQSAWPPK